MENNINIRKKHVDKVLIPCHRLDAHTFAITFITLPGCALGSGSQASWNLIPLRIISESNQEPAQISEQSQIAPFMRPGLSSILSFSLLRSWEMIRYQLEDQNVYSIIRYRLLKAYLKHTFIRGHSSDWTAQKVRWQIMHIFLSLQKREANACPVFVAPLHHSGCSWNIQWIS